MPGRITGWRQDQTGQWWAEITLHAPAAAVQQLPGEDYTAVPRQPAGPRYFLTADTRTKPPTAEMHQAGCWEIAKPAAWRRDTPMPSIQDARDQLKFPSTQVCPVCNPDP